MQSAPHAATANIWRHDIGSAQTALQAANQFQNATRPVLRWVDIAGKNAPPAQLGRQDYLRRGVKMASEPLTLAQLARAVGMSIEDVRLYQNCRLLQPPRRRRGRTGDLGFMQEHVERLGFIKQALKCGLALDDIAKLVNPNTLMTCGDVYDVTRQRLEHARALDDATSATRLEKLLALCPGIGGRRDCKILKVLASADC